MVEDVVEDMMAWTVGNLEKMVTALKQRKMKVHTTRPQNQNQRKT